MEIFLKRYAGATYERVYNVKVTAVHQSNGQTFTQFTTNGYAEFENVPPGIYNLSFSELPNGLVPITPKEVYVYANAHTYKEIQVNNLSSNPVVSIVLCKLSFVH